MSQLSHFLLSAFDDKADVKDNKGENKKLCSYWRETSLNRSLRLFMQNLKLQKKRKIKEGFNAVTECVSKYTCSLISTAGDSSLNQTHNSWSSALILSDENFWPCEAVHTAVRSGTDCNFWSRQPLNHYAWFICEAAPLCVDLCRTETLVTSLKGLFTSKWSKTRTHWRTLTNGIGFFDEVWGFGTMLFITWITLTSPSAAQKSRGGAARPSLENKRTSCVLFRAVGVPHALKKWAAGRSLFFSHPRLTPTRAHLSGESDRVAGNSTPIYHPFAASLKFVLFPMLVSPGL